MSRLLAWVRRRVRTLQFRVTVVATLIVGVVFALASFALVGLQERLLEADVDLELSEDLDAVSAALAAGQAPADAVEAADRSTEVVVARDGSVVAEREGSRSDRRRGHDLRTDTRTVPIDGDVVAITVARDSGSVEDTTDTTAMILLTVMPALTFLVGFVIWRAVGRTLRPVESIRADAAEVAVTDRTRRLPVPSTGDEIERLATTLNAMLDRLAASSDRQRQLVADAAHELRSPLAGIQARLEVEDEDGGAAWASVRPDLLAEVTRLQRLVDSLLLLSRSDAGQLPAGRQLVDLDEVVGEALLTVPSRPPVAVDATGVEPAQVRGDSDLLRQVVVNLLDNAIRHASTSVVVALAESDGTVELAVADDGSGIPPERVDDVFDRFVRLDDARARDDGGAGLGLAISREIVRATGGSISVDPAATVGARLVVTLPSARDVHRELHDRGASTEPGSRPRS